MHAIGRGRRSQTTFLRDASLQNDAFGQAGPSVGITLACITREICLRAKHKSKLVEEDDISGDGDKG